MADRRCARCGGEPVLPMGVDEQGVSIGPGGVKVCLCRHYEPRAPFLLRLLNRLLGA